APLVATSRAAVFGDVDGDGGVDVLVVNRDGPAHLLRNVAPDRGRFIRFRVLDENGRDAYGARVTVTVGSRRFHREVRSAYGYLAAHDPRVHLGLGEAASVDAVSVVWPDGTEEPFGSWPADSDVTLRRGN
ncbi:MAG: ASPIC/UnbV domain-containing protein, partial [Acidobacteriota bacterium]|nr:ASPIC/UnbV domain-containing protein [Acidobacteriota bacterium]